jgi:hypothetical protein
MHISDLKIAPNIGFAAPLGWFYSLSTRLFAHAL